MIMDLNWVRLSTGNRGAIGADRFYVVGKLDGGWFLETWADPDAGSPRPADVDASYGYRRMADAMAEAIEREETATLLCGKYGITRGQAHDWLADARKYNPETFMVERRDGVTGEFLEGWRVEIGTDEGGYTINETVHETADGRA
jgi:hypothetical protein